MEMANMYSFPALLTTIVIPLLVYYLWKAINGVWLKPRKIEKMLRKQGFKGNPYKLIIGDVKEVITLMKDALEKPISLEDDYLPRIVRFIHHTIEKHGQNCFAWMGPIPWLIITNAEQIKDVLTKYEEFQKPNHPITQLLMVGLFGLEGQTWFKHRRILNPAFHMEKIKNMLDPIQESCSTMISSWEERVSKAGTASVEIDVWPDLENLISEVISRVAFGSSTCEEGKRICHLLNQQAYLSIASPNPSNYIPGWRYLPTKRNREVRKICKEIEDSITSIINTRKKEIEEGANTKDDLLGLLLESNMKEINEHKDEKGSGLSIKQVVEECKLFFLAGSETTSALLVWALVLLSKHQFWQQRARSEILQVCANNGVLKYEDINHLKIVTMIINETLRLFTPTYMLLRKVYKDTKLKDLLIPKGTEIALPLCLFHQDPNIWGKDAKEFNPERFAEGIYKATNGQPIYFPFSTGPRICIGQSLGLLKAKVALSMMLQHFSFTLSPTYVHAPHGVATIRPQYGANLIITKL